MTEAISTRSSLESRADFSNALITYDWEKVFETWLKGYIWKNVKKYTSKLLE